MTTNDDQMTRGNRRLAADRNSRSAARNTGRRAWRRRIANSWRRHDDLQVLRLSRPEQQEDQLQDALKRDVKNGEKHGTSAKDDEKAAILG